MEAQCDEQKHTLLCVYNEKNIGPSVGGMIREGLLGKVTPELGFKG